LKEKNKKIINLRELYIKFIMKNESKYFILILEFKKILYLYIIIYKILFNITIEDYKPFNYFIYNKLYSKFRNS
jgi:hypothetical protein